MKVFEITIKQGVLHVVANSRKHAESQARRFEKDANRHQVRRAAEFKPGVFALGSAALRKIGVKIHEG